MHNFRKCMHPTAVATVVPDMLRSGWGPRHNKLERIVALKDKVDPLEKHVNALNQKVSLLLKASESESDAINAADNSRI